jgi:hypothetical protein
MVFLLDEQPYDPPAFVALAELNLPTLRVEYPALPNAFASDADPPGNSRENRESRQNCKRRC